MLDNFFRKPGETKNVTAKILAIVLAIVLWLYVMNEQNPPFESSFTIPLEVRNAATSYVIEDIPDTVRVKVRGPRSIVAGVLTKDLKAFVDVKGLGEGRHNLKVGATVPGSLELVEVNPDRVQVRIDTTITRQMPVEMRLTGTPAKGSVIGKATAANETVTLEGSKNVLDTVERVVAAVDLSGKSEDVVTDARLIPVNHAGKEVEGISIYPDKTKVTVNLIATVAKKMVDVKPVMQGALPIDLVVKSIATKPDKVEVTETAPGGGLDKMEAIYTEPFSVADINQDTEKEVRLEVPEGVIASAGTVIVTIKVMPR